MNLRYSTRRVATVDRNMKRFQGLVESGLQVFEVAHGD